MMSARKKNGTIDKNKLFNLEVLEAAATDKPRKSVPVAYGWKTAEGMDDPYVENNRFIGGMLPIGDGKYAKPPGVSLTSLMKERDIERVRFLKIDCEGCEWQFLTSPDIDRVDDIIGEFHFSRGMPHVHELLDVRPVGVGSLAHLLESGADGDLLLLVLLLVRDGGSVLLDRVGLVSDRVTLGCLLGLLALLLLLVLRLHPRSLAE